MTRTRNIAGIEEEELWPGLWGYTMEHDDCLYIPMLAADEKGKGALTAYLNDLEARETRPIKIPNVINERLATYLARRGYVLEYEWAEQFHEYCDVWVKGAREFKPDTDGSR